MNFVHESLTPVVEDVGRFAARYAPRSEVRFDPPDWKQLAGYEEWHFNIVGFLESMFIYKIIDELKTSKSDNRQYQIYPVAASRIIGSGEDNRYVFQPRVGEGEWAEEFLTRMQAWCLLSVGQ